MAFICNRGNVKKMFQFNPNLFHSDNNYWQLFWGMAFTCNRGTVWWSLRLTRGSAWRGDVIHCFCLAGGGTRAAKIFIHDQEFPLRSSLPQDSITSTLQNVSSHGYFLSIYFWHLLIFPYIVGFLKNTRHYLKMSAKIFLRDREPQDSRLTTSRFRNPKASTYFVFIHDYFLFIHW